ncbi:hypothetical protein Xaut_4830 (plasmid) [Xanthobacter versatilis]|uniref:Uncharacterized protein n=1 Tax=Xanthobacter autotrophicus (strain ATCC BAA-1158 / Py2) TaxID=78245 RepID=A7IPU6_XANP2|nr:hypothetical protein Xaut_4830 [Xanthobacter autotrophicus Py2]
MRGDSHALSTAPASPERHEPAQDAGDVLGSRRSRWKLCGQRVAQGVAGGPQGVAFGPGDYARMREHGHGSGALGHARRHQRAALLAVGDGRRPVGAAWHVARHVFFHACYHRRHLCRPTNRRSGKRSDDESCDRKDRKQTAEASPKHNICSHKHILYGRGRTVTSMRSSIQAVSSTARTTARGFA